MVQPDVGGAVSQIYDQVEEFHRAMGVPILSHPQVPSKERVLLRVALVAEEFFELIAAIAPNVPPGSVETPHTLTTEVVDILREHFEEHGMKVDLVKVADALADLDYVIEGTRQEFGIFGPPIAREVHEANMRKVGAPRREDGKIMKPEAWRPPDIEGALKRQGWKP